MWDGTLDRLVVYGGSTGTSASAEAWALNWNTSSGTWSWSQLEPQPSFALAGHTVVLNPPIIWAKDPEVFNPSSGSWQLQNSPRQQPYYPFMFVLPSGNLFYAGSSFPTYLYKRNVTPPVWQQFPANTSSPFPGGSAVMFRPGEIMKCGRDYDEGCQIGGQTAKIKIDASDNSTGWVLSTNTMKVRTAHNLTVLPNGKVLVTGGLEGCIFSSGEASNPSVRQPELWDPEAGQGTWSGLGVLASDPARRGYHSTAMLLPDGRILSAGGEARDSNSGFWDRATIFCPPYLFNENGSLARRPEITYACNTVAYGERFKLAVADSADSTKGACIIRPSAVTHSFNQDQRYVPLNMVREPGSQTTFTITMPTSANEAPPGDYMLFVLKRGVPSLAKWIRVMHDTQNPPAEGSLSADIATASSIEVGWSAPSGGGTCGCAAQYDLRWSANPILTENDFLNAQQMYTGTPKFPGSPEIATLDALPSCTLRYFALKTKDVRGTWSGMDTAEGSTTCGGCCFLTAGGPGATLEASATEAARAVPLEAASSAVVASRQTARGFSLERREGPSPAWRVRSLSAAEARAFGADTLGALIVRQRDLSGVHRDVSIANLHGGVGIAAIDPGREIIGLGSMVLDHLESRAPLGKPSGQRLVLASARHSRLGNQLVAVRDAGGRMDLQPGDTLDIGYVADTTAAPPASPHFLMVDSGRPPESSLQMEANTENVPLRFALHQNQPNPFTETTMFRFDLPQRESVSLEVLDIQGRRIDRVTQGPYPAGQHSIEWAPGAKSIHPGVYWYRIVAGSFRAERKSILLP